MQDIIKKYIESPEILNIYLHGSRVYKTNTDSSDYDFIIVIEDEYYFLKDNVSVLDIRKIEDSIKIRIN